MGRRAVMVVAVLAAVAAGAGVKAQGSAGGDYWSGQYPNLRNGVGAPPAQTLTNTSTWTGTHLFVWGGGTGQPPNPFRNTGGLYNPATDTWEVKPNLNAGIGAPSPRSDAMAVTAGSKIIVWGGLNSNTDPALATGGVYNPAADTWEVKPNLNSGNGAPEGRYSSTLFWIDGKMVVFGGMTFRGSLGPFGYAYPSGVYNGGVYDLATDTWLSRPILSTDVALPQFNASSTPGKCGVVWTGEHLVARGGNGGIANIHPESNTFFSAGGVYETATDTWLTKPALRSGLYAQKRGVHPAVWTGEWYMEWGGDFMDAAGLNSMHFNDGLCYDPQTDSFPAKLNLTSPHPTLEPRFLGAVFWTGDRMVVYGGYGDVLRTYAYSYVPHYTNGMAYDPIGDTWATPTGLNAGVFKQPVNSEFSVIEWTGDMLIGWGGVVSTPPSNTSAQVQTRVNTGYVYVPAKSAPVIRSGVPTDGKQYASVGQFWRHRVTVYGCPRSTVTASGMPAWMTLKALDTGAFLEGTPGANDSGSATVTITASNGFGSAATQSFTVYAGVPAAAAILPFASNLATVGVPYACAVGVTGYPPLVTVTLGGLSGPGPGWLSLSGSPAAGYVMSGTPTASDAGVSGILKLTATNGVGQPAVVLFTIVVGYQPQDLNHDGVVTVADVQLCVNLIVKITMPAWQGQGDVDGDSRVNVIDLQKIVNKLLGP